MIRFGIVGCGNICATHADALAPLPNAKLTVVYDEIPAKVEAIAAKYGVASAASLGDLFAKCDAVIVALPSSLHAPTTIAAARAGKHVLTEKPLDIAIEPARAMVAACEAANVKLGCISQHRFARDVQRLKAMVEGGELGRVFHADATIKWFRSQGYYDSAGWRGTWAVDGGGCLMNQGVHTIDVLQWIMGGVAAVRANTLTAAHEIEVEDVATALVEFRNGGIGTIVGSTAAYPGFAERVEVHGTRGSAVLEWDRLLLTTTKEPADMEAFGASVALSKLPTPEDEDETLSFPVQHRLQIADFVAAIEEGREPLLSGRGALEPLGIVLAIYESARLGGERIQIPSEETAHK